MTDGERPHVKNDKNEIVLDTIIALERKIFCFMFKHAFIVKSVVFARLVISHINLIVLTCSVTGCLSFAYVPRII